MQIGQTTQFIAYGRRFDGRSRALPCSPGYRQPVLIKEAIMVACPWLEFGAAFRSTQDTVLAFHRALLMSIFDTC
jgi:hypothetical protein